MRRWDPLQPDADLTEAHAPLDGSDGVTVGDDADTAPQPRYRQPRVPWWVLYAIAALAALAVIVILLAPTAGGDPHPTRTAYACRCGDRTA